MKILIVLTICIAFAIGAPATLETCACWKGYEPKANSDGSVMCYGTRTFTLKPCNLPEPPKCVCEQDTPNGILTDVTGTYCSISEKGQVVKKWLCENAQEWRDYRIKLETYEKELNE